MSYDHDFLPPLMMCDFLKVDKASDDETDVASPSEQSIRSFVKNMDSSSIIDRSQTLFFSEFSGGFEFRQFIEFIRKISKELPLAISPLGISTKICSSTRNMVVNISFRRRDLTEFYLAESFEDSTNVQMSSFPYIIVNLDVKNLQDAVKNIAKKDDGIYLFQPKSQPNHVCVQMTGNKSDESPAYPIRIHRYTPVSCSIIDSYKRPSYFPNITIRLRLFCSCLSSLFKARFNNVILNVYEGGLCIQGQSSSGNLSSGTVFGKINSDEIPHKFILHIDTASILSKLSNFQHNGVIRIYCSSSNLIRFECGIGCFGSVQIYIGCDSKLVDDAEDSKL